MRLPALREPRTAYPVLLRDRSRSPLHRRIVRFYDLPKETGVMVIGVEGGSPAQKADLREGDVIIAFGDQPVAGVDDLHRLLTDTQVGVKNSVTIVRRTDRMEVGIVPTESK